jgi:crotonobetainyl-CoA:carnitine CoA-transferase CaiB-like acyl-CoA transferase
VIKVESLTGRDSTRQRGPFPRERNYPDDGGLFLLLNANKRGITLDPTQPMGRELFVQLIKKMDSLVEDRPVGELDKIGLSPSTLLDAQPRLVITSITPFGQTGPYSHYRAYPLNTYHAGGSGYVLPFEDDYPEREPIRGWRHSGEIESGVTASLATLTAVFYAMVTGEGQQIDISKQEALMNLERMDLGRYPNDGELLMRAKRPFRIGGKFRCRDGYMVILPVQENQWQGLVRFMGNPEWAKEEKYRDEFTRAEHAEEIHGRISEFLTSISKEEAYHNGQANGVPISPIFDVSELLGSLQLRTRGFFVPMKHPQLGTLTLPSLPFVFPEGKREGYASAPRLGQDNERVFCGLLGLPVDKLNELRKKGVVG